MFGTTEANDLYREFADFSGQELTIKFLADHATWADPSQVEWAFEELAMYQPGRVKLNDRQRGTTVRIGG